MTSIENEALRICVNEKGGSLTSIFDKKKNKELLYQPIENSWQGQDVFIFPMIARLVDSTYTILGKEYEFKNHGLIRYMTGTSKIENGDLKVTFHSDEETLKRYPFAFKAEAIYHLEGNQLFVSYHIYNEDDKDMPFMVGGHPAFMVPGVKREHLFDLKGNYITFPKKLKLVRIKQEETFSFNIEDEDFMETDRIDLSKELFIKINTIILKADDFEELTLHKMDGSCVTMHKGKAKYLALWSANEWGNFVALEPWNGIPDYLHPNKDFYKKPGVQTIKPNEEYIFDYSVSID